MDRLAQQSIRSAQTGLSIAPQEAQRWWSVRFRGQPIGGQAVRWDDLFLMDAAALRQAGVQLPPGSQAEGIASISIQALSLQTVDAIDLFRFARGLLANEGRLACEIIQGDAELQAERSAPVLDQQLQSFLALALRCGFTLVEPLPDREAAAIRQAVVVLARESVPPRWDLDHLPESEIPDFLRLFRESFDSDYPSALWQWKFGSSRGRCVVAKRRGRLVAHYGSTQRTISYFGKRGSALQICDVMVNPRERGVMTKKGAMFVTAATFLELYLSLHRYTLAYGFPNRRHQLLGEKLGLYAEVAKLIEVRWPIDGVRVPRRCHTTPLRPEPDGQSVDRLWKGMQAALSDAICVVRDLDYLRYRYYEHPVNSYQVLCVRSRRLRLLKGIIVLRAEDDRCELLDIVAPLRHVPQLIEEARFQASALGCSSLYCWITETFAPYFVNGGGTVHELGVVVPTNVWVPGPAPQQLAGKWWLMSGDTEFR